MSSDQLETNVPSTAHRRLPPLGEHPLAAAGRADPTARAAIARSLDWRQAVGGALIVLGVVAVLIGWYGVSGTLDPAEQLPYISSGGFGGAALIAVGVTLLVAFEHARDREALGLILDELDVLSTRLEELERVQRPGAEDQKALGHRDPGVELGVARNGARRSGAGTARAPRRPSS